MNEIELENGRGFLYTQIVMPSSIITLITDFGGRDGYVGAMKGVMLSVFSEATIVDITHEVPPQDVDSAAFVVHTACQFFPRGSVHVVVVDPGVGSERRILCAAAGERLFLTPDNGVLKYVFRDYPAADVYHVCNSKYYLSKVSRTFHGRDIFAPVAAHLAKGVAITEIGQPIDDYNRGRLPALIESKRELIGEIIYVDRFGNLITNIPFNKLEHYDETKIRVQVGHTTIAGLKTSYFAGNAGELIALIGSAEVLEIAINSGHAQNALHRKIGDEVKVTFV